MFYDAYILFLIERISTPGAVLLHRFAIKHVSSLLNKH